MKTPRKVNNSEKWKILVSFGIKELLQNRKKDTQIAQTLTDHLRNLWQCSIEELVRMVCKEKTRQEIVEGGKKEKRKKTKPQKLLFLPFYFSSFALGLSNFSYKDIRDKKNEGKRKEIAYLLSLKNNNKKSYLKSS